MKSRRSCPTISTARSAQRAASFSCYDSQPQADERWSFVGSKANKQWLWSALHATTKQVIACYVGARSRQSAQQLWQCIPPVYRDHATCATDDWKAYEGVIPEGQHEVGAKGSGRTNLIERFNCTLRQRISRLVRDALSFSKLLSNHIGAIKYFSCRYNQEVISLLDQHYILCVTAKSLGSDASNKNNLNLVSHARETDGAPVKYGRSGKYAEYHTFPNYIVTFVSGNDNHSRVRRNPGFNMVAETKDAVKPDVAYSLVFVVKGGRLRYYINGRRVHDVQDPTPLADGQFAIRTWNTTAWWDDFEVGRVLP